MRGAEKERDDRKGWWKRAKMEKERNLFGFILEIVVRNNKIIFCYNLLHYSIYFITSFNIFAYVT